MARQILQDYAIDQLNRLVGAHSQLAAALAEAGEAAHLPLLRATLDEQRRAIQLHEAAIGGCLPELEPGEQTPRSPQMNALMEPIHAAISQELGTARDVMIADAVVAAEFYLLARYHTLQIACRQLWQDELADTLDEAGRALAHAEHHLEVVAASVSGLFDTDEGARPRVSRTARARSSVRGLNIGTWGNFKATDRPD